MSPRRRRTGQRGLTLVEAMLALAVMAGLFVVVYATIDRSRRAFVYVGRIQDRWQTVRSGMRQLTQDLSMAYVSLNENMSEVNRRTYFRLTKGDFGQELRFSSFAHQRLVEDARESDQCIIQYFLAADPDERGKTSLFRRETRRLGHDTPENLAGEAYVLVDDVLDLRFEFFDKPNDKWREDWDTTAVDGQPNRLPNQIRIYLTIRNEDGRELTLVTQAVPTLLDAINLSSSQAGASGTSGVPGVPGVPGAAGTRGRTSSGAITPGGGRIK